VLTEVVMIMTKDI